MSKEVLQEVLSYCQVDSITKSSTSNKWIHETLFCPNSSPRFLWRYHHRLLHSACRYGDVSIVHMLIAAGANVNNANERNSYGWRALHYASWYGHVSIVRVLLTAGANVNARNYHGTALHYAGWCEHVSVVRALIAAGANVNERDSYGKTALNKRGHTDIVRMLREAGATE